MGWFFVNEICLNISENNEVICLVEDATERIKSRLKFIVLICNEICPSHSNLFRLSTTRGIGQFLCRGILLLQFLLHELHFYLVLGVSTISRRSKTLHVNYVRDHVKCIS